MNPAPKSEKRTRSVRPTKAVPAKPAKRAPAKRTAAPRKPPAPAPVLTLDQAVSSGSRRDALVALRDHLAQRLLVADKDAAPLARQLTIVLREIAELPALDKESTLDDLAQRRASRRAAPTG